MFEEFDLGGLPVTDGIVEIDGYYPSRGPVGERAIWFKRQRGQPAGDQPARSTTERAAPPSGDGERFPNIVRMSRRSARRPVRRCPARSHRMRRRRGRRRHRSRTNRTTPTGPPASTPRPGSRRRKSTRRPSRRRTTATCPSPSRPPRAPSRRRWTPTPHRARSTRSPRWPSQGYFDGTTCHRLTTDGIFVLQCGDPTASGIGRARLLLPRRARRRRDLRPGHPGHGQRRAGHQRVAVLHRLRRLAARPGVHGVRPGVRGGSRGRGAGRRPGHRHRRAATAPRRRRSRSRASRSTDRGQSGKETPLSSSERAHSALARSGSLAARLRPTLTGQPCISREPVRTDVGVAGQVHGGRVDRGQRAPPAGHPDQLVAERADAGLEPAAGAAGDRRWPSSPGARPWRAASSRWRSAAAAARRGTAGWRAWTAQYAA